MKRSGPLKRTRKRMVPKGSKKSPKPRERASARFERHFHSEERVQFVKSLRCVACGMPGLVTGGGPIENHHEPPKGRGTYRDISPLCQAHHAQRHGPNSGVKTFWASVGKSYQEANAATEKAWLDHTPDMP